MAHIDLRDLDDDDLDAVGALLSDPDEVAPPGVDAADREGLDQWVARRRADPDATILVVTESGGFAGAAAAYTLDGEREVAWWIASHARGRGVGADAVRLLAALEPERPLYARVSASEAPPEAMLERIGFTEVTPSAGRPLRYVLPPTLE
ncbi:GNAT family N-acetyltransferase [Microbacterium lushaniae]|uniref:GNAT family N-acetyltransferase n=1 Tax=Microbacterium lushaniae TaxID=2614639 RepID=A0A5J6KZN5_9MICO|nr:GNAT family N-acetyltransferase [Microbacterium lushaniae]QEW01667.1 GNAT family N-acetyltransferase [Microbacterium lushaniae]